MQYKDLALLVPLSPEQRRLSSAAETEQRARTQVWEIVTQLLTRHIGKTFTSFMPSPRPWGILPLPKPYGILLGAREPAVLLSFYLMAKMAQEDELQAHCKRLYESGETVDELKLDENITVSIKGYTGSDPKTQRDIDWLKVSHSGVLTADCCLYHCGLGSSKINERQETAVFACVSDYALCVVTLGIEEEKDHERT